MKEPYKIYFHPKSPLSKNVTGNLPSDSLYPLHFSNAFQITIPEAKILRQFYSSYLFYVELYEIDAIQKLIASYEIDKDHLFLFFMLKGNLLLYEENGTKICRIEQEKFGVIYNRAGIYKASCQAEKNIFLVIAFRRKWIKNFSVSYLQLHTLYKSFSSGIEPVDGFHFFDINPPVYAILRKLYRQSSHEAGELWGVLKTHISQLLVQYNNLVTNKLNQPSYLFKAHLDTHYHLSDLSINSLVSSFYTTEKTLRENFKKNFDITPYAYLIQVRMRRAKNLLVNEKLPISLVYDQVGYKDIQSFRKQFKITFGYPPSQAKNNP
jgi:AraC-like DNA-binding protein